MRNDAPGRKTIRQGAYFNHMAVWTPGSVSLHVDLPSAIETNVTMLRAYFDDSGTHRSSNIVLVAGILGTEWQIKSLDRLWQMHVNRPLDGGKPPLRRYHATDCFNSTSEFSGWSRTETDYFSHELRTAIISAYGVGVQRHDWDEIVSGELRGFLGDAEGYAITQCYVKTLEWARENTFDPEITFVFDNRPSEIQRRAKTIGDAFARHSENPRVVGCEFLSSYDVRALQAADLCLGSIPTRYRNFVGGRFSAAWARGVAPFRSKHENDDTTRNAVGHSTNRGLHKGPTAGISEGHCRPFHKFRPFKARLFTPHRSCFRRERRMTAELCSIGSSNEANSGEHQTKRTDVLAMLGSSSIQVVAETRFAPGAIPQLDVEPRSACSGAAVCQFLLRDLVALTT
jgi:hypothetical protein